MSDGRGPMDGTARGGSAVPVSGDPASGADDRELVRLNEAGVVTGVCAGLGSYTRIDPIVWRVAFALTALAGGTGLALYLASWVMMRDTDGGPAMAEQLLNRRLAARAVPALLGAGLAAAAAFSLIGGFSWGTLVLATPLILGALVAHNRGVNLQRTYRELPGLLRSKEPPPAAPAPEPKPAYFNPAQPWAQAPAGPIDLKVVADRARAARPGHDATGAGSREGEGDGGGVGDGDGDGSGGAGGGGGDGPAGGADGDGPASGAHAGPGGAHWALPAQAGARLRRARELRRDARERRREARRRRGFRWFRLVFWGIVAATGITLGLHRSASPADLLGPTLGPVYLGSIVVIIGVALVAATWVGDPRGLIATGVLVTLALIAAVSLDAPSMRFGVEQWRPATVAEAERPRALTGGVAELDLTGLELEPGQRVAVDAEVRFGGLYVWVPASARVVVHGRASFGEIQVDDVVRAGTRLDVRRTLEPLPATDPGATAHGPGTEGAPGAGPAPADGATGMSGEGGGQAAGDSGGTVSTGHARLLALLQRPHERGPSAEGGAASARSSARRDVSEDPPTLVVDLRAIGADMEVRRVTP
ncbi:PspC domain-containing protein [Nocardiopsis sediminis]|uniref:PspC domain-containing protein n=1 Tax=Nocardiopsis sediminis TaxID=1778267 RepID=A0ABV8FY97_9ACTN